MPTHPTPIRLATNDTALAWELAATARPYLDKTDADLIYIAVGIGDAFAAIDALITAIAHGHIPLDSDLVSTAINWLDCYRGHDAEPRLRRLLTRIDATTPQHDLQLTHERTGLTGEAAAG